LAQETFIKTFLRKGFKTVYGKVLNRDGGEYPPQNVTDSVKSTENQFLRAIVGFGGVETGQSISLKDSAVWATKKTDKEAFGSVHLSKKSSGRVYSAQVFVRGYRRLYFKCV